MDRKILIGGGVLALAAAGTAIWLGRGASTDADKAGGAAERQGRQIAAAAPRAAAKPARPARIAEASPAAQVGPASSDASAPEAAGGELSAADQKLVDAIQAALDDENLAEVRSLAESLVDHPSAEVRQRAIEALQWFGAKALDALTPFLADADEDARSAAMTAVEQALAEMDSDRAKLDYIESLFKIRGACDADGLAMLGGQLKGLSDSAAVVDAAVRVIEANRDPAAVKEMREVYEFVTGEPYTTPDAAQQWQRENAEVPAE